MIDQDKMRALATELRKDSGGRYKWYAMGRDEKSYFIDFNWEHDAERWLSDQKKSYSEWLEREGIHIVKKLFQTELETNAAEAADAIDLLLAELEAAAADKRDYLDTLVQVLNVIGYSEEFAAAHPDLKVSEGVKLFLAQRQEEQSDPTP